MHPTEVNQQVVGRQIGGRGCAASCDSTNDKWQALLQGIIHEDEDALASLYDQASRLVYRKALAVLRDAADAEEVTVDVFGQVWRQAARYDGNRATVAGWLLTITKSRAIDRLRWRCKYPTEPLDLSTAIATSASNPEQRAIGRNLRDRIRRGLEALPVEQRLLLNLTWTFGLSHRELADHLGLPLGTVKSRIRVGLLKLRTELASC